MLVIKSQEKRTKEEERAKKPLQKQMQRINKITIRTYVSIITLNGKGLNVPTKRHRVAEWIEKIRPTYVVPTRDSLQI